MTGKSPAWVNIPEAMRFREQWCIALENKAPQALVGDQLVYVSVHDRAKLHKYDVACQLAEQYDGDIGYIITADDPFACIDMDVKDADNTVDESKWTTPERFALYKNIIDLMDSYTELSRSGKGIHIWVQGSIGAGLKRNGVEVYSQERFMICTGNAFRNKLIEPRQDALNNMVVEMRQIADAHADIELEELEETESDEVILAKATSADNSKKFNQLCAGKWQEMGYASQSEADNALMSMFTFYSQSNAQCRRLFRFSELGKRQKAVQDNVYLNRTIRNLRAREAHEREAKEAIVDSGIALSNQYKEQLKQQTQEAELNPQQVHSVQEAAPAAVEAAQLPQVDDGLPWPPGLAGAIAGFIYNSSPRPVREVAIVAALGLLAGICGKAYTIPQSGLNVYLILVARSAIGKETMHSGISHLLAKLRESIPLVEKFVDFSNFVSGPALTKACAANTSFINLSGEWGRKLQRLSKEDRADGPMQQLRTVMTELYQKSGPTATVGGLTYSNKDNNVASVSGVAYSMMGETTPGTFYDSLTESMMEDGFLSRFTVVEYNGQRPPTNPNPLTVPDVNLTEAISGLVVQALTLLTRYQHTEVMFAPDAKGILDKFDVTCDQKINETSDEGSRQMWNRAHLKVLRIASLLAVADEWFHPIVTVTHVEWAMELIYRDIGVMSRRIAEGDIGMGDSARERKLIAIMRGYIAKPVAKSYKIHPKMHENNIIPRKYLQTRVARVTAFSTHRLGSSNALDSSLRSLADSGYIMDVDNAALVKAYNFHGKCYRILPLPDIPSISSV